MNVPELARRFCVSEERHHATLKVPTPCQAHIMLAQKYWGLAGDPNFKGIFHVISAFRADKLGKGA